MDTAIDDTRAPHPSQARFTRLMDVGAGAGRHAYARMLGEGFDAILAEAVVYGIAEGFSREAGNPEGDPMRFHEGARRNVGEDLPEGLDGETLADRARDAMEDARLLDGLDLDQIAAVALVVGADIHRDLASAPRP